MIRILEFLLLFLLCNTIDPASKVISDKENADIRFTHKPGNITVIENTTALFDWRHTILNLRNVTDHNHDNVTKLVNDIAIAWFFHGKNEEHVTKIMSYSFPSGLHMQHSDSFDRLHYLEGVDSAAIQLDRVTPKDEGFYQVKVVDLPSRNLFIYDVSEITTIDLSAIKVFITAKNQAYDNIVIPAKGGAIRLPSLSVSVPDRVYVSISVSQTAPPPDIKMATYVGDVIQPELPCGKTYFCERNIAFFSEKIKSRESSLNIELNFGITNLKIINVTIPLSTRNVSTRPTSDKKFTSLLVATVALTFAILISLCAIWSFSNNKKRDDVRSSPDMQKDVNKEEDELLPVPRSTGSGRGSSSPPRAF